ncbi:hypothetical protein [Actinomadura hibisca]|uniref:hypothetical protein n=1 Tax=Actinomadura hibisca TaxID=68565 RepID=UPI001FDFBDFC|nr:hypothetical protein [Actinomadura hibisca]
MRIMEIPGARSVTLVDGASGLAVAAAGRQDGVDQHEDAAGTTDVVRAVLACPALGGTDIDEIIVGGAAGHHLIALVDAGFDGHLFLHLLIDHDKGNLALARIGLRKIVGELTEAGDGR